MTVAEVEKAGAATALDLLRIDHPGRLTERTPIKIADGSQLPRRKRGAALASITVAIGPRSELRVELEPHGIISQRLWFADDGARWRPSHSGVDIPVSAGGALVEALIALSRACQ